MADASADARIGTVIAGYRIESRLGRGGMGVVYRARHLGLDRPAALKIIAPDLAEAPGFRERFEHEARMAASLAHPNVVTVYDAGEVDGTLYLAMQYVEGADLAAILARDGRLRPYRAIDVCRQVAAALDAAHAHGLIHRDVKPANVLVAGRNVYLSDFGLTKQADRTQLTPVGDVVGTIHYVAPEQIEGRPVSARTDVYALGCLLYHCLTGEVPFGRDNDVGVIYAHLSEAPPRPSAMRPDLPPGLDEVIAKAMEKRPDRRFGSCGDLMAAARAVVDAAGPLAETARVGSEVMAGVQDRTASEGAADRRARVLLAGMDASTRAIARVALGDGVDVRETASAGGAMAAARDARPDLVILPSAGAADVVGALRADPLTRESKVLLVGDSPASGADERLATPFSPLQLQVKLRKLLGSDAIGT